MTWKSPNGQLLYRIGDVIISTNSQNPSTYFGGTWQLLCPGRTLVCVDTSQSEFNTVKKTGGENAHILSVAEMPSHTHIQNAHTHSATSGDGGTHRHIFYKGNSEGTSGSYIANQTVPVVANHTGTKVKLEDFTGKYYNGRYSMSTEGSHSHTITINNTIASNTYAGGGLAHNNLQPFMSVYMWVRIA